MSTTEQRVAVVTGGARGIGAATAVRLAAEGRACAGYMLLLEGRHHAVTVQQAGEHWGDDLLVAYQEAIDGYAARYGIGRA